MMTKRQNKASTALKKSPAYDSNYQPSKGELEREYDMPGAPMDKLSKAFFNSGSFKTVKPRK